VNLDRRLFSRRGMTCALGLMLLTATACNFSSPRKTVERNTNVQSSGGPKHPEPELVGGRYCVETMTLNPPGPATPIHFSYKVSESDGSSKDFEADLSGDTLDRATNERHPATEFDRKLNEDLAKVGSPLTIRDGFVESAHSNHYTRADKSSWTEGWGGMEQGATPWSLFILKPPATPAGFENISGFETLKYAVDTTHQSQLEKYPGNMGWGVTDYNITGSAWVAKDGGCILQYSIDLERDGKDGKVSKTHYEGGVTKH
jgi:hypothetical protein